MVDESAVFRNELVTGIFVLSPKLLNQFHYKI